MKLSSAINKARRQIVYGWTVATFALVVMLVGLLKFLYIAGESDTTILHGYFIKINYYITMFYNEVPLAPFLWDFAPAPHLPPNFSLRENIPFIALIAVFVIGCTARDSGHHLAKRIKRAKENNEERSWGQVSGQQGSETSILSFEIQLESEDRWHTRPIGVLALAIIGGYVVNFVSKLSGLM